MSEEKPKVVIRYSGKKILEEMFLLMPKLGQSLLPCLLRYFLNYQIEDMEIKDQLNSDNHPEIIFSFVLVKDSHMILVKISFKGLILQSIKISSFGTLKFLKQPIKPKSL